MISAAHTLVSVVLALTLVDYPLASPTADPGSIHSCADTLISIEADELVDHDDICNSAEDALVFFDRLGLELTHPIVITVAPNLPDWMRESAVGCYREEDHRVFVLTFPEFEKRKVWFSVPVDRNIYRSLVTHEVAHAVARCNLRTSEPTIHAEEYVAYVAMFVMMNSVLRAHILVENPSADFDSESEINEMTYLFDPMRFGIAAYRHYLKKEHGNAFLQQILSGNALTNSVREFP